MRMRKLGNGQQVVFYVPDEIETKIRTCKAMSDVEDITISEIILWTISQTQDHIRRGIPPWATQGERYTAQQGRLPKNGGTITKDVLESLLEKEAQSIEERYRPLHHNGNHSHHFMVPEIKARLTEYGCTGMKTEYREEQERELAPEIEEEHYIETERALKPAQHDITDGLREFIQNGSLPWTNKNFFPAFRCFRHTTARKDSFLNLFPNNVLVSRDFATTVDDSQSKLDLFQRNVRWVLTGRQRSRLKVVIISPFEANTLFDEIRASTKVVLHMYAPRQTRAAVPLDDLNLCPVPEARIDHELSWQARTGLNLFAGQLYFKDYQDYINNCKYLDLAYLNQQPCQPDGYRARPVHGLDVDVPRFSSSPVPFMTVVMEGIRKHGNGISKTHMGKLLGGQKLTRPELEPTSLSPPDDDNDGDQPPETPKKRKAEEPLLKQEPRYDANGIKIEQSEEPVSKVPKISADIIFGKSLQRNNEGSQ